MMNSTQIITNAKLTPNNEIIFSLKSDEPTAPKKIAKENQTTNTKLHALAAALVSTSQTYATLKQETHIRIMLVLRNINKNTLVLYL